MGKQTKRHFKKLVASVLVLTLLSQGVLLLSPKKASAQFVPTQDSLNLIENTKQNIKEFSFDSIAYLIAKGLIRQLTTSIVNWINSGFNGSPAFVTNPEQFLIDTADKIAGNLIEGSELGFLCDPFRIDIRIALGLKYRPFQERVTCTLSEVIDNVRGSVDGFIGGDFKQGGWQGWLSLTNEPQNNVYGAQIIANNELGIRIAGKQSIELAKLNWGGGFLSWEKCEEHEVSRAPTGLDNYYENAPTTNQTCEIQTPGGVINDQLSKALGSGIDQLNLADEFNEIVNALVVQLAQQALGGGGLRGASRASNNSRTSFTYNLYNAEDTAAIQNIRNNF